MKRRPLTEKELEALRHIRNMLVHEGAAPSVRVLQNALGYNSPNAAAYIIQRLIEAGYLDRRNGKLQILRDFNDEHSNARMTDVPLVGSVSCGKPLLAEQNIEMMIAVSVRLAKPPHRYFLLRANGDSMNRAGINDGDFLLIRQQSTADSGAKVVALIDDHATVKCLRQEREAIVLIPKSSNPAHKPIILDSEFQIQGVVIATIPADGVKI